MTRFLRLTNMLLNVNQIRLIEIRPDKYKIKMIPHHINGSIILGSGGFNSVNDVIDVCKKEDIADYKIVSDWLLSEKHNNVWH